MFKKNKLAVHRRQVCRPLFMVKQLVETLGFCESNLERHKHANIIVLRLSKGSHGACNPILITTRMQRQGPNTANNCSHS